MLNEKIDEIIKKILNETNKILNEQNVLNEFYE